ncbi:MAG: outer membrane protein assembly factor BamB family protein [Planctomycetota bacterium]|jgi:outer membrane protein assembly factor BamB
MSRKKVVLALLVSAAIMETSAPLAAAEAEWPCWRGPDRNGISPDTGLLKQWPEAGPKLLWKVDGLGKGFSTVAMAGETIYVTGDVGDSLTLFALDMNGKSKWKVPVDRSWTRNHAGSRSTPTIDEGRLYLLSGHGKAVCMDAGSGDIKWSKTMKSFGGKSGGWGYAESILIYNEMAIVKPGGKNCIIALNKVTGETIWRSKGIKAGPEYSSCIAFDCGGMDVIATGTRSGIVGVSAQTGERLWLNAWCKGNTANCPDPQYSDGYLFWANGYGKGGICLELTPADGKVTAEEVFTTRSLVCQHGGYVIVDGHIYGNHNRGWTCMELETGKVKWYEQAIGKGSLCYADGMLYVFGERGGKAGLLVCSHDSTEVRGTFSVEGSGPSWAHPVVIGGRLYLRYDENLYCFDVKAG